jgi:hypothetical protein
MSKNFRLDIEEEEADGGGEGCGENAEARRGTRMSHQEGTPHQVRWCRRQWNARSQWENGHSRGGSRGTRGASKEGIESEKREDGEREL